MKDAPAFRKVIVAFVFLLLAYWLFTDTFFHYLRLKPHARVIRFAYWGGYADHRMWGEIIGAFKTTEPLIQIRPEWLPLSGYASKLEQQLIAGDAPDVLMCQDEPFPLYAQEHFADLTRFLNEDPQTQQALHDCWPSAKDSFGDAGVQRGLPVNGGNVLIFCNLDAFDRASQFLKRTIPIPVSDWTLDDFIKTCRDLTLDENGDGEPEQFGFLQPHWVYYLPFIWSHGANLLDESRTYWRLTGPEAIAAFGMYSDLRFRFRVSPAPLEYAGQNSDTAFLSGRVAMCVNGPWFQAFLNETALRERYRVAEIPKGPGGNATRVTWDGVCIPDRISDGRKRLAWKFARFLLSFEAQEAFARYHRAIPARRSVADSCILYEGEASAAAFVRAMGNARVQPITRHWQTMHLAMQRHLTSVILDEAARRTPEEAISALSQDPGIVQAFGAEN